MCGQGNGDRNYGSKNESAGAVSNNLAPSRRSWGDDGLNNSDKGARSLRSMKGLNAWLGPSLLLSPSLQLFLPVFFSHNSSITFQA